MTRTMTDRQSVAANALITNILAGKLNEFLERPSIVNFYIVAAAGGMNASAMVGNEIYVQDQEVSSNNRFPNKNEDLLSSGAGGPGERVSVDLRNTTAGAIVVQTLVEIIPVR